MEKIDYKKKYEELKSEYEELNDKYQKTNSQLYIILSSRSYKLCSALRKVISPVRQIVKRIKNLFYDNNIIDKFVKKSDRFAIVPCSFEFDEFVNQRPINYAKFLADRGYKVLYVVWQWDAGTQVNNAYKIVYKNILQVPLFDFLQAQIDYRNCREKIFYINFPHKIFSDEIYKLRNSGFTIHYDIMDEWEEFSKVGQADWYERQIEEKVILESDFVSAVSPSLIEKFAFLRTDIALVPNGFYEKVTGVNNKNIALKKVENGIINIGYFGHLTDAWFNWKLLFEVAEKRPNYHFHIIGYGLSRKIEDKIEKCDNITFYGKIPTNQLYRYVKNWNIGIILFKESTLSKAVDPIKIYEYLFMGLPVIASGIKHLKDYPNTYVIENSAEFIEKAETIVRGNDVRQDMDSFLQNSAWETRFSIFLDNYDNKGMSSFYEK